MNIIKNVNKNNETNKNPGSYWAVRNGCTCPILDNYFGEGVVRYEANKKVFIINEDCPLHGGNNVN